MSRKLKTLGIAIVASLAMSAMAASAQAAPEFHAGNAHTILKGKQETGSEHVFTAGESFGGISCTQAEFSGTTSALTEKTQTMTPVYENCADSFGRTAHVSMNGCGYIFSVSNNATVGTTEIECPPGKEIVVTVTASPHCTVRIPAQKSVGPVTYHNIANGDVTVTSEAENVTNTTEGGFFICGVSNGHHTEGTYFGNTVVHGTNTTGTENINISVS
jgi:hypothetical protein